MELIDYQITRIPLVAYISTTHPFCIPGSVFNDNFAAYQKLLRLIILQRVGQYKANASVSCEFMARISDLLNWCYRNSRVIMHMLNKSYMLSIMSRHCINWQFLISSHENVPFKLIYFLLKQLIISKKRNFDSRNCAFHFLVYYLGGGG